MGHHLMPDHVGGRARPQHIGVVDAVTAGQQCVHHREQLATRPVTDTVERVGQRLDAQVLGRVAGRISPASATNRSPSNVTSTWSRLCEDLPILRVPPASGNALVW